MQSVQCVHTYVQAPDLVVEFSDLRDHVFTSHNSVSPVYEDHYQLSLRGQRITLSRITKYDNLFDLNKQNHEKND